MYSIIISIAVVIYSVILVDFNLLFKDISVNNDVIASTQAFYTAEGVIEKSLATVNEQEASKRIESFLESQKTLRISEDYFNDYNLGAEAGYLNLQFGLAESDLMAEEALSKNNRAVQSGVYLADAKLLDNASIYGLEPRRFKSFIIREVSNENNFDKIQFDYNLKSEDSEVILEIFAFPREGENLNFKSFADLEASLNNNVIHKVTVNTADPTMNGKTLNLGNGQSLTVRLNSGAGEYKNSISVSVFQPIGPNGKNYIIQYQTLDNEAIHYRLSAFRNAKPVVLPNVMQTIDVLGVTTNGLFQRIKFQRETEESLLPGLNFVHFSNQNLHK